MPGTDFPCRQEQVCSGLDGRRLDLSCYPSINIQKKSKQTNQPTMQYPPKHLKQKRINLCNKNFCDGISQELIYSVAQRYHEESSLSFHPINMATPLMVEFKACSTEPGIIVINHKEYYTIFSNITYFPHKAQPLICLGPWDQGAIVILKDAGSEVASHMK